MGLSGRLLEILSRNKFVLRGAESQNDFLCAKVKRGRSETCLRTSSVKIFSYHHPIFQHCQCLPILNLNLLSLSLPKTPIIASTLSCGHSMMSSTTCTLYRFSWKYFTITGSCKLWAFSITNNPVSKSSVITAVFVTLLRCCLR